MTIQQFASDLASSAKNDLVAVVDQFRRDENTHVVLSSSKAYTPWFDWADTGDDKEGEPGLVGA
ncbi:MAG: hypothetical protein AAGF23_19930 [Acidobacteriota bacterium]